MNICHGEIVEISCGVPWEFNVILYLIEDKVSCWFITLHSMQGVTWSFCEFSGLLLISCSRKSDTLRLKTNKIKYNRLQQMSSPLESYCLMAHIVLLETMQTLRCSAQKQILSFILRCISWLRISAQKPNAAWWCLRSSCGDGWLPGCRVPLGAQHLQSRN